MKLIRKLIFILILALTLNVSAEETESLFEELVSHYPHEKVKPIEWKSGDPNLIEFILLWKKKYPQCTFGVSDITNPNQSYMSISDNQVQYVASIVKISVLYVLIKGIDESVLTKEEFETDMILFKGESITAKKLAEKMIKESNNHAVDVLINYLGEKVIKSQKFTPISSSSKIIGFEYINSLLINAGLNSENEPGLLITKSNVSLDGRPDYWTRGQELLQVSNQEASPKSMLNLFSLASKGNLFKKPGLKDLFLDIAEKHAGSDRFSKSLQSLQNSPKSEIDSIRLFRKSGSTESPIFMGDSAFFEVTLLNGSIIKVGVIVFCKAHSEQIKEAISKFGIEAVQKIIDLNISLQPELDAASK